MGGRKDIYWVGRVCACCCVMCPSPSPLTVHSCVCAGGAGLDESSELDSRAAMLPRSHVRAVTQRMNTLRSTIRSRQQGKKDRQQQGRSEEDRREGIKTSGSPSMPQVCACARHQMFTVGISRHNCQMMTRLLSFPCSLHSGAYFRAMVTQWWGMAFSLCHHPIHLDIHLDHGGG